MLNLMSFSPSNFSRYVSQTDYNMDESNDTNEPIQKLTTNNIPSLMSLTITPPIMTTTIQQKTTVPPSVIKENIEPLPFPQQHGPGPIQRPNKLSCTSTTQLSSYLADSTQSPSTPDVLEQINHLLDHQNSITTVPSTPNISNSSTLINDMTTPNVPWTPFAPAEWSSWANTQNPFAQRQISKEELAVWPSALGATASSTTRAPTVPEWNALFSSAGPSSMETTKQANNNWLKFLPASDSSSVDGKQENDPNNPFWNSINLNEWSKTPSDENNNDNDQSRWDFAR
jgi:hypothetical protein